MPPTPDAPFCIGSRLKTLRTIHGRRAKDVAEAARVSPSQLSRIEAGRHDPRWSTVERIMHAIGADLADLKSK